MAKKKQPEEDLEDELEEDLEDLPSDDKALDKTQAADDVQDSIEPDQEDLAEDLSFQLEEEVEDPYKYLRISIEKDGGADREYYLHIKHQSHGFLNYMVRIVLKIKGVDFAAYKNTSLAPPVIYIRTDGTRGIKLILKDTIKAMKIEWKGMGNAVAALKL